MWSGLGSSLSILHLNSELRNKSIPACNGLSQSHLTYILHFRTTNPTHTWNWAGPSFVFFLFFAHPLFSHWWQCIFGPTGTQWSSEASISCCRDSPNSHHTLIALTSSPNTRVTRFKLVKKRILEVGGHVAPWPCKCIQMCTQWRLLSYSMVIILNRL